MMMYYVTRHLLMDLEGMFFYGTVYFCGTLRACRYQCDSEDNFLSSLFGSRTISGGETSFSLRLIDFESVA